MQDMIDGCLIAEPTGRVELTGQQIRRLKEAAMMLFVCRDTSPETMAEYDALQRQLDRGMETVI